MSKGEWDKMRQAKEESYFVKANEDALKRLAAKRKEAPAARPSPVTGEPMEQVVLHGVVVDRCPTSKGIWLDAGELEQILETFKGDGVDRENWVTGFFKALRGSETKSSG